MPRRLDHEAQAYEAAALNEQLPASLAVANEDDDGYSMYFFWPLSAPGILYPEEFVYEYLSGEHSRAASPTLYSPTEDNLTEEGLVCASGERPVSPTPCIESDYVVVPEESAVASEMGAAGYSEFFTSGLATTSRDMYRGFLGIFKKPSWLRRT